MTCLMSQLKTKFGNQLQGCENFPHATFTILFQVHLSLCAVMEPYRSDYEFISMQ